MKQSKLLQDEKTLRLKNAGGMRLIRRSAAVDSIILYDDMSKNYQINKPIMNSIKISR